MTLLKVTKKTSNDLYNNFVSSPAQVNNVPGVGGIPPYTYYTTKINSILDSGKTSDYVNMTQRPPRVNGWWKKGAGTWSGLV